MSEIVSSVRTDTPILSVIVPTHNVGAWVREMLQSVLSQSLDDLEVIVVDDHSEDDTVDVVKRLAAADPRIRLMSATHRGGGSARNEGVAHARGRFLAFADGDDLIPDGAYAAMVDSLRETGSDIVVGDYLKFSTVDTWRPTDSMPAFDQPAVGTTLAENPTLIYSRPCWNKVFRRDWWRNNDLSYPDVPRSNDIVPMVRAYLSSARIDVVPDVVYLYRERPGTGSMTAKADTAASILSYLDQETVCAALVAENGDPGLARTYARLIYDRDGYRHVSRYLERWTRPSDDDIDVASATKRLLDAIPTVPSSVPAAKRLALQLVAEGEFAAAVAMVSAGSLMEDDLSGAFALWRRSLVCAEELGLLRSGDGRALSAPIVAMLTAPRGSEDVEGWRGVAQASRTLLGDSLASFVPESTLLDERLDDVLRTRADLDACVSEVSGEKAGIVMTGSVLSSSADVMPALWDAGGREASLIEASDVSWRSLDEGRREWRARFNIDALPLHRPLTLVVAIKDAPVSTRFLGLLPVYDAGDPFLYEVVGTALIVRRRRHWILRAGRRAMIIVAAGGRRLVSRAAGRG